MSGLGATPGRTRRGVIGSVLASSGVAAMLAACGVQPGGTGQAPTNLTGPFDLLMQGGSWAVAVQEQAKVLQAQYPQVQVNIIEGGGSAELAEKIRTTTAAGTPPDGFFHYSHSWRGINAAGFMLPLTPQLFRRDELERLTFPSMLQSVYAKNREVYFLPWIVGMNASVLIYNTDLLGREGIVPKSLTTLDAMVAAAKRFVVRQGATMTRAGLTLEWPENLLQNWILDQGATFYDERARKWTWQTPAAEQALQWMVNVFDKQDAGWRPGQSPGGSPHPIIRGDQATMLGSHAGQTGSFLISNQDAKLWDMPLPPFVAGKQPHYYVPGIAGLSLAASLKPDSVRAKIGAALYRLVFSPEGSLVVANNYSGAILSKGLYENPRFKDTRFGAMRADFAQNILAKTQMLNLVVADSTTQPEFNQAVTKALAGTISPKTALGDIQQLFTVKEEEAWRNLG